MSPRLSSVLVKPAGPDCNMACDYCFYLDKAHLFEGAPRHRMSSEVQRQLIRKTMQAGSKQIIFVWQGGEPTLVGPAFYERAVELQMKYGQGQTVGNALQTNGLLLNERWIRLFRRYRFLIGISLDGPEEVHDRHRRRLGGQGSHARGVAAARRMLEAGIAVNALTVVNAHSVKFPEEIYNHLRAAGLEHMQFIPCADPEDHRPDPQAYGRFLCRVFDLWRQDFTPSGPATSVRNFESLLHLYAGFAAPECTLMESCGIYLVVEHDGGVYACDFYVEPEYRLGDVMKDDLQVLLDGEEQKEFGLLKADLHADCISCPWRSFCLGGCTRHRPSPRELNYFCAAYKALFRHAGPELSRLGRHAAKLQEGARQTPDPAGPPAPGHSKVRRNDPCPCGSGKKFKRCCG